MTIKNCSIMIQGTASTVGKSILCTALCRIFTQDGYDVNPFKSQNMSLNSYITHEGDEMGRAQVMQAEAANKAPSAKMNPILLKPTSDRASQVIINGKVRGNMDAIEYFKFKKGLREEITDTYLELRSSSDIVVIEGAGSPAEINLKDDDIVNMGMAKIADAPVILVGDIDKGGVFASLAGTMLLLNDEEKSRVKGVIINKFRGSREILEPGLKMLEDIIKVPVLGVIPYFHLNIEDEDSVTDWEKFSENANADIDVAVIKLPYMSNFTDFNALRIYKDVNLRFVEDINSLGLPDVIILPGSKSTISDMLYLQNQGFTDKIINCCKRGSTIIGICGGYQMLGLEITDELGLETSLKRIKGLGLIHAVTVYKEEKTMTLCEGEDILFKTSIKGYEIHMGETKLLNKAASFAILKKRNDTLAETVDGVISEDGLVFGTYIHGIFDNGAFTRSFLNKIRISKGLQPIDEEPVDYFLYKNDQYDKLAQIVRENLDMSKIYSIVKEGL
jgi:adenosylcobyric acid synthase